jgi:hypothetical protein
MRQRKPTFMDTFMNEPISIGGALVTRANAFEGLMARGQDRACADYFAFGREPLSEEDQKPFRATCACGVRWLSVFPLSLDTCDWCEADNAAH